MRLPVVTVVAVLGVLTLRHRRKDNVSVTTDGRRLDSKEAVLQFFAELDAERE